MKKTLKMMLVIAVAINCVAIAKANNYKTAKGAALLVYSATGLMRPAPEADPIVAVVDINTNFKRANLGKNNETKKFANQNVFLVWQGYINVPETGNYAFSLSYNNIQTNLRNSVIFQINGNDFLTVTTNDKKFPVNATGSVALQQGNYEITIIQYSSRGDNFNYFDLKYWNRSTPLRKMDITPASFIHVE